ncbi:Spore germination protein YaaH [Sporobacter termitidis DSM 10068]|uniref:Spore germination protein YaaH n=1 Tax=Sporobacter termitidis DSM 10068 TaxID=1123282 RepID=A0A1M5X4G5_9FIRM|nr:S-layer homology domain-containing protein [Sporobacter termitidis]SHH94492.1 Spore germination protein YaaH [Sporobacter termitidis DSM 10068]
MKKLCLWLCAAVFLSLFSGISADALDYKFNMSYIYFGSSTGYTSLVDGAQDSLDEVAPNYFTLDASGSLKLTNAVSPAFVSDMHARNIRVVPYLTNDWANQTGVNALNNREALSTSIAAAVAAYNLDGVNVDIENVNQDQRAAYVDLLRLLREKLPAGKTIAVAVAANPWGATTGWQGSYDYTGLAQYADYLLIMAYDEHYDGSAPGSVDSISFVEKSIAYALSKAPKEKLVLGLPFYGRIWSDSGSSPGGYGVSNTKVDQLLAAYGGTVTVDSATQSARATFTVRDSDTKPVVGGKALVAGTYTIWYENSQTLKARLNLVQKYGLKGTGSWSLGQESAGTWDYYTLWLNGCTFADIQNSWARDDIFKAYMNGWVNGTSSATFEPDAPLTRAEAAAVLVRMLGYPLEANTAYAFDDAKGGWAEAYINTARRYNLISGVGGNVFAPDRPVTRQEIAVMVRNALGYPDVVQQAAFSDVTLSGNSWSYGAITALSASGVITGYPDGTFRPEVSISRAELTALLTRLPDN